MPQCDALHCRLPHATMHQRHCRFLEWQTAIRCCSVVYRQHTHTCMLAGFAYNVDTHQDSVLQTMPQHTRHVYNDTVVNRCLVLQLPAVMAAADSRPPHTTNSSKCCCDACTQTVNIFILNTYSNMHLLDAFEADACCTHTQLPQNPTTARAVHDPPHKQHLRRNLFVQRC
jgi:hypothetical protein